MNAYKIICADGNYLKTEMNATLEEAKAYYLDVYLQFGDTEECPRDKLVRVIEV